MTLTRKFNQTVIERVERDPEFAKALLDETATLFLSDEPETARLILRDLVNATVGFEQLAVLTDKPSKSLHRMLSPKGNPSMDNLAAISDEVDIRLEGKSLVIVPVHAPRTGWFVGYKPEADVEPLAALPVDDSTEEWAW